MTVLVLTLAGPLQSWGSTSRFTTRATDDAPTKSGVIGLLAAAQGRRRTDPLEDYIGLRLGVRIDQPGRLLRDFQTARSLDGSDTMPLSYRYYREDARYVVVVEAAPSLIEAFTEALSRPAFPLYLGRRSCPPAEPLIPRLVESTLGSALRDEQWRASTWWKHRHRSEPPMLEFRADKDSVPELQVNGSVVQRDEPVSFDPAHRQYGWRTVQFGRVPVPGAPAPATASGPLTHDPMGAV